MPISSAPLNLVDLEFAAGQQPARTPEKSERYTIGFAPALYGQALELIHVADGGRYAMAKVRIEEKRVPPALLREETARKCAAHQEREGAQPTKEQRDALEAAAYSELLARAFPRVRVVRVLFLRDLRLVLVGTANKADVDEVSGLVRGCMPGFKTRLVRSPEHTRHMLSYWLHNGAPHDEKGIGWHLGNDCTLKSKPLKGEGPAEVVSIRNAELRKSSEVTEHLKAGKRVERLALGWHQSEEVAARFSVDREFFVRGLKLEGLVKDSASTLADAAAIYAAEFYVEASTVEALVLALRKAVIDLTPAEG